MPTGDRKTPPQPNPVTVLLVTKYDRSSVISSLAWGIHSCGTAYEKRNHLEAYANLKYALWMKDANPAFKYDIFPKIYISMKQNSPLRCSMTIGDAVIGATG